MSSIEIKDNKGVIKGATLLFTHVAKPDINTKTNESNGYVSTFLVDSSTGKEFTKNFPKSSCNMIETGEILNKYGITPPNPEAPIHYVVKIRANDVMKGDLPDKGLSKGDPVPMEMRPKAYEATPEGDVDITTAKLIGKGSKGDISFTVRSDAMGKSVKLSSVRVEELIEYTPRGRTNDFGKPIIGTENAVQSQSVVSTSTNTAVKPTVTTTVDVSSLDL